MPKNRKFSKLIHLLENSVLILIVIATVYAIGEEIYSVLVNRSVSVGDLLLMFIYLEVLAMVHVFFESGKVPVRMPLYIGIVALARYLILDMKNMDDWRILSITIAGLILAVTTFVIRIGHVKFPYPRPDDE
ncbi:phosphate-starvation-inducible E [Grimontia hollisae]|nr:phosphate-starvation-inducible PsiE family protein [Grimontia hollisae]AMG29543.1 phosphate-starvation-inducible E [Grimontia hollisae]MDF2184032.1 phosphate-starvation-inducible PsiE family protein [Grimontia hollisae]STO77587.1 phosphate-starvation-inducible protein PsiE [Grimontia hollisae]STO98551.1 phosphate-starvation-inducible protein PsiE [Grimontia hollisae]STQ75622.1 phosphate-starvation-inducible protein PsiE [Grimontia hollisae]